MLSALNSLNLKFYSKQYNIFFLNLIVAPQLSGDWRHNYSTKTRQAGQGNEQCMYSLKSMEQTNTSINETVRVRSVAVSRFFEDTFAALCYFNRCFFTYASDVRGKCCDTFYGYN
jgi:hypothetical protein